MLVQPTHYLCSFTIAYWNAHTYIANLSTTLREYIRKDYNIKNNRLRNCFRYFIVRSRGRRYYHDDGIDEDSSLAVTDTVYVTVNLSPPNERNSSPLPTKG